jgi:hypothetical protein
VTSPSDTTTTAFPTSAGEAFGRASLNRLLNNLLGLPHAVSQIPGLKQAGEAGARVWEAIGLPNPQIPLTRGSSAARATFDVVGQLMRGDVGISDTTTAFPQAQEEATARDALLAAMHPNMTFAGDMSGDVQTILLGRLPLRSMARQKSQDAAVLAAERAQIQPLPRAGVGGQLDDLLGSRARKVLERTLKVSGEAGVEGAVLALIHEGDPVKTAIFAAGGQLAGSMMIGASAKVFSSGKLAAAFGLTAITHQIIKEGIPGGRDEFLRTIGLTGTYFAALAGLGMAGALLGMGRVGGPYNPPVIQSLAKNFPNMIEAISTIPRAAWISAFEDFTRHDPNVDLVMEVFRDDPDYFGPAAKSRIVHALTTGVSLVTQVNELMKVPLFQRKLEAASAPGPAAFESSATTAHDPSAGRLAMVERRNSSVPTGP